MHHESKPIPLSPQKGKSRESKSWQFGWWDFQPLAEQSFRPVEWSQSSVIFSAHPLQPLVTAHHFSSSKQFLIPSPVPIASSPSSFRPPTVISISPGDVWLFAYFPGVNFDGIACMWKRGPQIDSWVIKEYWNIAQGSGIVAASWLGTQREWITGSTLGSITRLPSRGPRTPVSSPTLLLVTQDHHVTICYLRHYIPSLKFLTCSIAQPGGAMEGQPQTSGDLTSSNLRRCSLAAIGLNYYETSIIIATRSCHVPLPKKNDTRPEDTHSSLSGEINQLLPPDSSSLEWESWHEESTINLCEVQLRYNGVIMGLTVDTLPPLVHYGGTLAGLNFISIPPFSDAESIPSTQREGKAERGQLFLTASWLDFGDYTSTPKSDLSVYSIFRQPPVPGSSLPKSAWGSHQNATRTFTPSVLVFNLPLTPGLNSGQGLIYAGTIDVSGSIPKASSWLKKASIGQIRVLNLSDLSDNGSYMQSQILAEASRIGQDLPLSATLSPNSVLLSTTSSSLWPLRAFIQTLPKLKINPNAQEEFLPPLSVSLASAIVSGRSASDITHVLSLASTPITEVVETLICASNIINDRLTRPGLSTLGLVGEVMAIYRQRSLNTQGIDKDLLVARWKTAHDICSLAALTKAFEDCQDGETYDLDAVWQLIALVTWLVSFSERFLKECVTSSDLIPELANDHNDETPGLTSSNTYHPLNAPILLHLVHPFALGNFVTALTHLQQYRTYVGSLSARGENAQIAKDVLVDLVDNSGIDFTALKNVLAPMLEAVEAFDNDSYQKALILCQPVPTMHHHLCKVIPEIRDSSIVNKLLLFIKPYDFVDGIARLSLAPRKDKNKDVISKRLLVGTDNKLVCLRCGGETAIMDDLNTVANISPQWRAWQQMWILKCICGGKWRSS